MPPRLILAASALLALAAAGPASAEETTGAASPAPGAPLAGQTDVFVGRVRQAIKDHDLALFENELIDWDGARPRTRRLTLFQIRGCLGRSVKTIAVEDLPKASPDQPLIPAGYRTNMPVTNLLRIEFAEQSASPEETPACVFMLAKKPPDSFRIVLVLPAPPAP